MPQSRRLFCSGSGDVEPVFSRVITQLAQKGISPIRMPFPVQPTGPARASLKSLAECETMLLLVGDHYGTPREELGNISVTELEFDEAVKRRMPIFCFISSDDTNRAADTKRFVAKIKEQSKEFIYNARLDFQKLDQVSEEISAELLEFRWVPKDFLSFGEWEKQLENIDHYFPKKDDSPLLPRPFHRSKLQEEMGGWLTSKRQLAILITGFPGFGKSLTAYHTTRNWLDSGLLSLADVMVITSELALTLESTRAIQPDPKLKIPVLIIIEDADDRTDLAQVIRLLMNSPHAGRFRLLLTGQPGSERLIFQKSSPVLSENTCAVVPLQPLSREEIDTFQKSAGLRFSPQNIGSIRQHTGGVPLFVDLFFRGGVFSLQELGTAKSITPLFLNYVLRDVPIESEPAYLSLIKSFSLLGLSAPSELEFKTVMEAAGNTTFTDQQLEKLRGVGLLVKAGRKFRLQSRVIQDFVISYYWAASEGKRELVKLIYSLGDKAKIVIENLARAEWAAKQDSDKTEERKFEDVWAAIETDFITGTAEHKALLAKIFEDAGYYLPVIALRILRNALNNIPNEISADYLEVLSELAYAVALNADFFDEAADILWSLAKLDRRSEFNRFPSHPIRKLQELAEFKPGARLNRHEKLLSRLKVWSDNRKDDDADITERLLKVADKLLAKEWQFTEYSPAALTFHRGPLTHNPIIEKIKLGVIALLKEFLLGRHGIPGIVSAGQMLKGETEIYQPKEYLKVAEAAFASLIHGFETFIKKSDLITAYSIYLRLIDIDEVAGLHKKSLARLKAVIADCVKALESLDHVAFKILEVTARERIGRATDTALLKAVRKELLPLGPGKSVDLLDRISFDAQKVGLASGFIALAGDDQGVPEWPEFSTELAEEIARKAKSGALLWTGPYLLSAARGAALRDVSAKERYMNTLNLFVQQTTNQELPKRSRDALKDACKGFLHQITRGDTPPPLFPEEVDVIKKLNDGPDFSWGHLVNVIAQSNIQTAKEMLFGADIQGNERLADNLCSVIFHSKTLLESFSEDDWKKILEKLIDLECDGFWTEQFLTTASNKVPAIVAVFYRERIRRYDELREKNEKFRPLPFLIGHHMAGAFKDLSDRDRLLLVNEALDALREAEDGMDRLFAAEYARLVSGPPTEAVLEELSKRIETRDEKHVSAVAELARNFGPDFPVDNPIFTEKLIETAAKVSGELLKDVTGSLAAGVFSRSSSRSIGVPSPEYTSLKDKASKAKRLFSSMGETYRFFESVERGAEEDLQRERLSDEEFLDE